MNRFSINIMKGKRGIGHHLDWIIGISIFMMYVLFMIVTIKPGVQPLHKGSTLLTIVQDNFVNNVTWNITRVPLNIEAHCVTTSPLKEFVSIEFPFAWENTKTRIYEKSNNAIVDFSISGNLIIKFGTSTGKKEFYILYSDDENFAGSGGTSGDSCSDGVTYIYGVPELLKGLSEDKIDYLASPAAKYDEFKNTINYPTNNDFTILVEGSGNNVRIHEVSPPKNANVYVKQFTDFILKDSGEKVPVTVTIKVW